MATKKSSSEKVPSSEDPNPAISSSCYKNKKNVDATFFEDVKDHINDFIHASMDEHKSCFQNTIKKMFSMSKVVAETKEVESSLPIQTSLTK